MSVYKGAILVLIVGCVGAIAPPVRYASAAPVFGEISKPDFRLNHGAVQGTALAALDPTFDISPDGSPAAEIAPRIMLTPENMIVGIASFYEGAQETSSGEQYDPAEFTAAAQLEIRDLFGGIRYGKNYQPAYAIGEFNGKKIIVKFNDVGPLMPGRKFDLSRAAMAYFDDSLQTGLLPAFKMTALPLGQAYKTGPVSDEQLVAMGIAYGDDAIVTASIDKTPAEDETPADEIAISPEAAMERDDALQEKFAYAASDESAENSAQDLRLVSLASGMDDSHGVLVVFAPDGNVELLDPPRVNLGGLIEAGRRLAAFVGDSVGLPRGNHERGLQQPRKDARVEEGAGLDRTPHLHHGLI